MAGNLYLWSTTAATNSAADNDINWVEGQLPSTVNDSARGIMAGIAGLLKDTNSTLTTGGSANAQTVTSNIAITALATGLKLHLKAGFTNTAACTLNLTPAGGGAFGAKAIKIFKTGGESDPVANQIRANGHYIFQYDSAANAAVGAWILLNPTGARGSFLTSTIISGSGNHTLDANCIGWEAWWVGGGGGGGGSGTSGSAIGGTGGDTTFSAVVARGGSGAGSSVSNGIGGSGGTGGTGSATARWAGGDGSPSATAGSAAAFAAGGLGGSSFFGGGGQGGIGNAGSVGASPGSGAGGASTPAAVTYGGGGGGAGEFCYLFNAAAVGGATVAYVVGAGGSAGGAGTSGFAGAVGASGFIMIRELLQ